MIDIECSRMISNGHPVSTSAYDATIKVENSVSFKGTIATFALLTVLGEVSGDCYIANIVFVILSLMIVMHRPVFLTLLFPNDTGTK